MAVDRDIYTNDVDFSVLALQDSEFNKHLKSNGQLDFINPDAVKQLTLSLLKRDFGLHMNLPDDRLCPPVPNRFNYILWVQDLLDTTSPNFTDRYSPNRKVVGLDIGTGASCIYPLLGCAQRPEWRFAASDIDEENFEYAKRNIILNKLQSRIRPLKTSADGPLIPLDTFGFESIDFTICNPPFYGSEDDLLSSAKQKARPPHSACTGSPVEMVTPGGEVAFVTRMIEESLHLNTRVQWYTSMLGKLSSVTEIVERLKENQNDNWCVTEFVQGTRTKRWAVAWSWADMRPTMAVARGIPHLPKHLLPFPSEVTFTIPATTITTTASRLNETVQPLDLSWRYKPQISTGVGIAQKNVWSRSARRKKQKDFTSPATEVGETSSDDEQDPALVFKIDIRQHVDKEITMTCRWLEGKDPVLFESFCGMLRRQILSPLQ